MRKLLLYSLLAAMLTFTARAQESPVDKGSMMVGGTIFIDNRSGDMYGDSETLIYIMPSFGYFMSPGFMVGADLLLANDGDDTDYGIGPSVRYYFNAKRERAEINGAMYPYIRAFMLYETDGDDDFTSFGGGAGINYMLSRGVSVDFGIRYSSDSGGDSGTGSTLGVGAGIQAFVF